MRPLASMPQASKEDQRTQIDMMLMELQSGRIALVSAIMQFRHEPQTLDRRMIRRALVSYLRLQKLTEAAAKLLMM